MKDTPVMMSSAALSLPTADAAGMRTQNSTLVLRLIWRERQISRADIARHTGLSPSTVSAIVAELERAGLVREIGAGASRGGRRPVLVGFRDDAFVLVGVELGATHVSAVLTDLRGNMRAFRDMHVAVRDDPKGAMAMARALIDECLASERVSKKRVVGIGVAVPSPVHPERPGKLSSLIMPAWRDYDVQETLASAFGVPVFVDNDANLGALSERFWGAGAGGEDLAFIKVATGIGSGHIINGALYRGSGGTAGEIGHIAIDPNGPPCVCGSRGCLATLIGAEALLTRARARWGKKKKNPTVTDIVVGARSGDPVARELVEEVGRSLGVVVAGLLNLLNPAIVVLGGEITSVGDVLLDPLRASIRARALSTSVAETQIVASRLGARSIAVGAATMVLDSALADRSLFPAAGVSA
ncbi:MAG TPA: ROK family transcriptional regulator [Kofleriaceae bacterium]|nr:ROK family transcriptional regulator [Kofleriaceae bacterium]